MNRFGLSEKNIGLINSIFVRFPKIEKVILYGSRAKGNYRNGSDIDLTIIDQDLSYAEFVKIDFLLDDLLLPYKIDLSQQRKISNPDLIDHIYRVGQVFYRKEVQSKNVT